MLLCSYIHIQKGKQTCHHSLYIVWLSSARLPATALFWLNNMAVEKHSRTLFLVPPPSLCRRSTADRLLTVGGMDIGQCPVCCKNQETRRTPALRCIHGSSRDATNSSVLKVPMCDICDRFDFRYFHTIKSFWVGDVGRIFCFNILGFI